MITTIIQAHFLIEIHLNISEQENKWQIISDLFNAETMPTVICLPYAKKRKNCWKRVFKENGVWRIEQQTKRRFLNYPRWGD